MIDITPRLHLDYRPMAEATLSALEQEYPQVPLKALELYDPEPGDRSLGHCEGGDKIVLSAYWFAQPKALLDAAVARGREVEPPGAMPWHGRIGGLEGEFERLLCHEFGHLLADVTPGAKRFARAGHAAALAECKSVVSGYALCDVDEWLAETFAALRLGGSGPQPSELGAFLLGKDEGRISKENVDYEPKAKNPEDRCKLCRHFEAPDACALVRGIISPAGWCRLFNRR